MKFPTTNGVLQEYTHNITHNFELVIDAWGFVLSRDANLSYGEKEPSKHLARETIEDFKDRKLSTHPIINCPLKA